MLDLSANGEKYKTPHKHGSSYPSRAGYGRLVYLHCIYHKNVLEKISYWGKPGWYLEAYDSTRLAICRLRRFQVVYGCTSLFSDDLFAKNNGHRWTSLGLDRQSDAFLHVTDIESPFLMPCVILKGLACVVEGDILHRFVQWSGDDHILGNNDPSNEAARRTRHGVPEEHPVSFSSLVAFPKTSKCIERVTRRPCKGVHRNPV